MKPIIKIENLSKQYRLGTIGTVTISHDLKRWWTVNIRGQEYASSKSVSRTTEMFALSIDPEWV